MTGRWLRRLVASALAALSCASSAQELADPPPSTEPETAFEIVPEILSPEAGASPPRTDGVVPAGPSGGRSCEALAMSSGACPWYVALEDEAESAEARLRDLERRSAELRTRIAERDRLAETLERELERLGAREVELVADVEAAGEARDASRRELDGRESEDLEARRHDAALADASRTRDDLERSVARLRSEADALAARTDRASAEAKAVAARLERDLARARLDRDEARDENGGAGERTAGLRRDLESSSARLEELERLEAEARQRIEPCGGRCGVPTCEDRVVSAPANRAVSTLTLSNGCRDGRALLVRGVPLMSSPSGQVIARPDSSGGYEIGVPRTRPGLSIAFTGHAGDVVSLDLGDAPAPALMVVLEWEDPVDLDLHVLENGAAFGAPGHVWREAAASTGAELYLAQNDDSRQRPRFEVYATVPGAAPPTSFDVLVDYASRGTPARVPYCGGKPFGRVVAYLHVYRDGERDNARTRHALAPVECGVQVDALQRIYRSG